MTIKNRLGAQSSLGAFAIAAMAASSGLAPAAHAQDRLAATTEGSPDTESGPAATAGSGIQEIVVTAQRRSENAQKVPVAVTTLSAATLGRKSIPTHFLN